MFNHEKLSRFIQPFDPFTLTSNTLAIITGGNHIQDPMRDGDKNADKEEEDPSVLDELMASWRINYGVTLPLG
jgi:hypothetical protein